MNPAAAAAMEHEGKMPGKFAGWLIAVGVMAGMYALALALAVDMPPTSNLAEAANQSSVLEFANTARRVSTEQQSADAKCQLLVGAERSICKAEVAADLRRARAGAGARARATYKGGTLFHDGINLTGETAANDLKAPPEIDVALYRAHRQLH